VDPHHFDADPDQTYHPDADPDAEPDSDFIFDVDLVADPTFHPDPSFKEKAGALSKNAKIGSYSIPDPDFY
jgi:hypothetical protein